MGMIKAADMEMFFRLKQMIEKAHAEKKQRAGGIDL